MQVSEIWQYPVKSMIGGTVLQAELNELGMVGDRTWAARDEVRGGIRGAKKIGNLMQLSARYVEGGSTYGIVEITLPGGSTVRTDHPDINSIVSAALDHQITLWPLQPADQLDHYRRGAPDSDDFMEELRAVFGREADEPLPDLSIFPPVIMEFESPPGTYLDVFPLMIMTTSALRSISEALPDSNIDIRRFRPSVVVDTSDAGGHPEFGWIGRNVRLGSTELHIESACPRCVMVTREVAPGVPVDRAVLRHVVRDLDQNVGVYATVAKPGVFSAGDAFELVD